MIALKYIEDTGPLPTSVYKLIDGEKEVGLLQIRHKPSITSTLPQDMASHIYYEIKEEEQGKGYGNKILELAKEEAKRIGLSELRLTVWDSNIPSQKIIQRNGGILIKKESVENKTGLFLLYTIRL